MTPITTRIARLTVATVLTLGLGAAGAGPALASYNSWAGSAPPNAAELQLVDATAGDASPDGGTWSG